MPMSELVSMSILRPVGVAYNKNQSISTETEIQQTWIKKKKK